MSVKYAFQQSAFFLSLIFAALSVCAAALDLLPIGICLVGAFAATREAALQVLSSSRLETSQPGIVSAWGVTHHHSDVRARAHTHTYMYTYTYTHTRIDTDIKHTHTRIDTDIKHTHAQTLRYCNTISVHTGSPRTHPPPSTRNDPSHDALFYHYFRYSKGCEERLGRKCRSELMMPVHLPCVHGRTDSGMPLRHTSCPMQPPGPLVLVYHMQQSSQAHKELIYEVQLAAGGPLQRVEPQMIKGGLADSPEGLAWDLGLMITRCGSGPAPGLCNLFCAWN